MKPVAVQFAALDGNGTDIFVFTQTPLRVVQQAVAVFGICGYFYPAFYAECAFDVAHGYPLSFGFHRELSGCLLLFNQFGNGFAQLRALRDPVVQTLGIQAHAFLFFVCNRIVKTYALDETAVAAVAAVSCHNVVKRTFF